MRGGPVLDPTPLPPTYQEPACPLDLPPLQGAARVDVAIVGAGYTGLAACLHLAEQGASVAVLEAQQVGWGGSGRAFGQVVPYSKHDDAHLLAAFGPDWGERLGRALADGPEVVFGLADAHGMACQHRRSGLIFAAHSTSAVPGLERRAEFWTARGADVQVLHRNALAAETGTRFYRAGLLDRRGGVINPLAYARGLARAALAAGGAIYEHSRALSLQRQGGIWQMRTEAGALSADQVLLATDAYTDALWPGLARCILPLRAYQLVSAPLSDNLRRTVLPRGQPLTDTRRLYSGIRVREDGRLHVSVDGPHFDHRGRPDPAVATARVRALFPHLPPPVWEHQVAGWVGISADQYPHIHRLAPGLLAAIGLSGRGIAFGTLLGQDAARRMLGRPDHEWIMPDTELRPIRGKALARPLGGALLAWYRLRDTAELRRRSA